MIEEIKRIQTPNFIGKYNRPLFQEEKKRSKKCNEDISEEYYNQRKKLNLPYLGNLIDIIM